MVWLAQSPWTKSSQGWPPMRSSSSDSHGGRVWGDAGGHGCLIPPNQRGNYTVR